MTDTPLLMKAIRVARALRVSGCTDLDIIVEAVLRTALPWDLPAERLEAMAEAVFDKVNTDEDWTEYGESLREVYREDALCAYHADPLMRELYPEQFR